MSLLAWFAASIFDTSDWFIRRLSPPNPAGQQGSDIRCAHTCQREFPMPAFQSLTPNLVVSDIPRSLSFYRDVLGFSIVTTVPEAEPFVFVWLQRGDVQVF